MIKPTQWLGLRGRSFLAFSALTGFTLLACVLGWVSYQRIGEQFDRVVAVNIHALQRIGTAKSLGSEITLGVPGLVDAANDEQRLAALKSIELRFAKLGELVEEFDMQGEQGDFQLTLQRLTQQLALLDSNVQARLALVLHKREFGHRLRWLASAFQGDIDVMIEKASGPKSLSSLESLYRVNADVNLLINLLDRAQHLGDLSSLIATQLHVDDVIGRLNGDLFLWPERPGVQQLQPLIAQLVLLSRSDEGVFSLRRQQRDLLEEQQLFQQNLAQQLDSLNQQLAEQAQDTEQQAQLAAKTAQSAIEQARLGMLALLLGSVLLSTLLVWLYVGRNIVARITRLDSSMRRIASGDLDCQVLSQGNDEIATMGRSLEQFRDQLSALQEELVLAGKLAAMGQLSAGIAHEINQPLAAIRHYSYSGRRLLEADKPAQALDNLQHIESLTKRAVEIITRLKALSRDQAPLRQPVSLSTVLDNVKEGLVGDPRWSGVELALSLEARLPQVSSDPVQLEQVLVNLFNNALDALEQSAEKSVQVAAWQQGDFVLLSVTDSGPGIDEQQAKSLFEPFFTTKPRGQNLGLGLTISFNILKRLGGSLRLDSDYRKGARFVIQLPINRP